MRRTVWSAALVGLVMLVGCAGGPIRDNTLVLDVTPQPLKRGEKALVVVNAPMDAVEVVGTVRVMGSPQAVFRKDVKEKKWYFYRKIDFSPWIKPGEYTLRVVVTLPEGKKVYTETSVNLQ